MLIEVKLLKGFSEKLIYKVPEDWDTNDIEGKIVKVPLKQMVLPAIVTNKFDSHPNEKTFKIRNAIEIENFPHDANYDSLIKKLSVYYQIEELHFIKRIRQFMIQKEAKEIDVIQHAALSQNNLQKTSVVQLTQEQQDVVDFVVPFIKKPKYLPTLVHGVTGSGKTEIYKRLILTAIEQNKSAILLLPEVTLATNFENILREQLPSNVEIFGFHSSTTIKQKQILWQNLLKEKPILIIGVHLPTLLPIANLGLIIVDEEHEAGFQEKKHPKLNSKEVALLKAQENKIPIILGSATPSITSLYNTAERGWKLFKLHKRFGGSFPNIKIINLKDKKQRRNFWISQELENEIKIKLQKKEQVIIFLNRRGFSFFVQCKLCGFIFECPNCSVSLTLHNDNNLNCHYCEHQKIFENKCPKCPAKEQDLIKKGIGTQQVVTILEKLFPQAKIARADMDTTTKKALWKKTLEDFKSGEINILVGTQSITKGFHFPKVTLVGILWSDLNLHFPIYNAAETCLQQLIQVAGRAGRQSQESTVIAQVMSEHSIFNHLNEQHYLNFYELELEKRKMVSYPPFIRLAELELKSTNEKILEYDAQQVATKLRSICQEKKLDIFILGPAKPPIYKLNNSYSRKIYIKSKDIQEIFLLVQFAQNIKLKSQIFFTPNPLN
ncbi:MAG: Primosomal protein N' [candidate division TM6 bacterium GW2011_GWF2_32_72]|nr:MAG: Primosomal protein N' [candidate division TM6 bacterium GW2011_GWF2_32_72]